MRIGERRFGQMFQDLLAAQPPAVIVADGLTPPDLVREACTQSATPLILSPKPCSAVIDLLRIYLSARLADTVNMHGVFMDVLGMGVLITGDSGVGKSELALELISRGHGLVADDVVEMARIAPATIEGRCPGMLRDFLEVRGLGLLNIRTIFRRNRLAPQNAPEADRSSAENGSITDAPRCRSMPRRRKCWACRSAKW
jgi:HPr kinase/phosphorylase